MKEICRRHLILIRSRVDVAYNNIVNLVLFIAS